MSLFTICLCMLCIGFEVYHVATHNEIFRKCNPYYSRMRILKHYRRMYEGCMFIQSKDFSKASNENRSIDATLSKYRTHFDNIAVDVSVLPTPNEFTREIFSSLSPSVILTVITSGVIECVYFILYILLLCSIPFSFAVKVFAINTIVSAIHVWNERDKKMRLWWYPAVDSFICIAVYIYIFYFIA